MPKRNRFVRPITLQRFLVVEMAKRALRFHPDDLERANHHAFDHLEISCCRGNDLQVQLREFRLAVGAQVFVAEAAHDLEYRSMPEIIRICLKICGDCGSA